VPFHSIGHPVYHFFLIIFKRKSIAIHFFSTGYFSFQCSFVLLVKWIFLRNQINFPFQRSQYETRNEWLLLGNPWETIWLVDELESEADWTHFVSGILTLGRLRASEADPTRPFYSILGIGCPSRVSRPRPMDWKRPLSCWGDGSRAHCSWWASKCENKWRHFTLKPP